MTDVATGFLQAMSAFGASRLGRASGTTYKDARSVMTSLVDGVPNTTKPAFDRLKTDIETAADLVEPIIAKIEKQTAVIGKMASDSAADAKIDPFTAATAARIAARIGTALLAIDEAVRIVATEVARRADGTVDEAMREQLMGIWNPWVTPFTDLGDGAGKLLDSLGEQLGFGETSKELAKAVTFDREKFRLAALLASTEAKDFGVVRLNETRLEAFLGFARREFVNPSEEDKQSLVQRDDKWWRADEAVLGLRIFTVVNPGLQNDPLLKKIMPGSKDPAPITPTAITLDSIDGLYLGDGRGAGNERLTLPIQFDFPAVEIREVALGIVRNPAKEVTGLEVTTVIAAKLGDAVGIQVGGAGAVIGLDGTPPAAGIFPWAVGPRWPDAIGLRVKAGPVSGGGYLERKTRVYGEGAEKREIVEFGGVLQLEILKAGVFAVGILSPDPFSLVLVMGVRFPTAIELSFGFTFNGIGGILALNRRVDTAELIKGMQSHFIDRVLFPEDPVAEAPKLLDQVAKVFPQHPGGFVVGPIIELGWGSQARIVEAKLGVVLALPDPMIIILGAVRIRAPSKLTPLTDLRCEVYGEISGDRLLVIATLRDSKIAGIAVSGDLGLLIQWGGGGAFALSVGGFHPRYEEVPPALKDLQRLTIDLSPPVKILKITVQAYFAVTAGAVMAGVRGDMKADVGVAKAHAWLQLDMIFRWVPRFGFAVELDLGIDIEVLGLSFARITFHGLLEGTTPWKVEGRAVVDVWFAPTFELDLGPITWGDDPAPVEAAANPLQVVQQALSAPESWKAVLPAEGDLLVTLGRLETEGLVAHPLAALEVTQSRIPLETHIDRIGGAGVTANRVALGLPTTTVGEAAAVSTVTAPFAPGQFLALEGEALLARSGFDDLPSGCRVAAATTPVAGTPVREGVTWRTYIRDDDEPQDEIFDPRMYADAMVAHSRVGRGLADRDNPYLTRTERSSVTAGRVTVLPAGAATVRLADDGTEAFPGLGVLTATEAARVAETASANGLGALTAVVVGVM